MKTSHLKVLKQSGLVLPKVPALPYQVVNQLLANHQRQQPIDPFFNGRLSTSGDQLTKNRLTLPAHYRIGLIPVMSPLDDVLFHWYYGNRIEAIEHLTDVVDARPGLYFLYNNQAEPLTPLLRPSESTPTEARKIYQRLQRKQPTQATIIFN